MGTGVGMGDSPLSDEQTLEFRFKNLALTWSEETKFLSSSTHIVLHPAYQEIIGMGKAVLPLILRELKKSPDHWFAALHQITGENPVPPEHAGSFELMTRHWLKWGEEKGLI